MRPRRDWEELVRAKLAGLAIEAREKREVIEELAAHLDETYEELRGRGLTEEDAAQRALREVKDWHDLRRRIQTARRKENTMSNRVKQFWLPGLLTLFLAMVLLEIIQMFGPNPWTSDSGNHLRMTPVAVVYVSWLLTLPLIGAMGAYLSNRAGGSRRAVFSSIVFPVLPYLAFFVVGLPVALILDEHVAHNITIPALFVGLSAWVIFPTAALLAGGLPVHLYHARRLSSGRITGS
jgi:hypothetical protein